MDPYANEYIARLTRELEEAMASETMRRLDEIVGAFREGVIVRVSCGGMLCGECIQCTARAAKASLQREQRAAQDEISRLTRELDAVRHYAMQALEDLGDPSLWPRDDGEARRLMHSRARRALRRIEGIRRELAEQNAMIEDRRALAKDTEGGYADRDPYGTVRL